jgi:hypothetical protein
VNRLLEEKLDNLANDLGAEVATLVKDERELKAAIKFIIKILKENSE